MSRTDIAIALMEAIEQGDWNAAQRDIGRGFLFFGPSPEAVGQQEWIEFQQALKTAIPDWSFDLKDIQDDEDEQEVLIKVKIKGTHKGPLNLPLGTLPKMPPTFMKVSLPEETVRICFDGDKIMEIHTASILNGGVMGLLGQMGLG